MTNTALDILKNFKPSKKFFVGVDSDGCAFPTMELKHKECFIPNIIKYWGLQAVSKFGREAAEWVNLYSVHRGVNRFPALVMTMELLKERPELQQSKVKIPDLSSLKKFIDSGVSLSNPSLEKAVQETHDPVLKKTLDWSQQVNADIESMVHGAYPFPFVKDALKKLSQFADIIVVSATPTPALQKEWQEHDLAKYVALIAGQEMGSKKDVLQLATTGKYEKDHVLMVGDAPGDHKAAKANQALFLPINPGYEEASWELFFKEGLDKFINSSYANGYEEKLIKEFEKLLPTTPWWKEKK